MSILLFSCNENRHSDATKQDFKVLILGNSIVRHTPAPDLGWYGDWGMAASQSNKDFVSILTNKLTEHYNKKNVIVYPQNVAFWESDFNFDLNYYSEIKGINYDLIIIRLGENVNSTIPEFSNYYNQLDKLINFYKESKTKVIITGNVWNDNEKDEIQSRLSQDKGYKYISFLNFQSTPENYSYGLYTNSRVSRHPSDLGMKNIANLLFNSIILQF